MGGAVLDPPPSQLESLEMVVVNDLKWLGWGRQKDGVVVAGCWKSGIEIGRKRD